ncbi:transcriptional regulator [Brevibacillus reuszeri]|uniref:Transcriptional regulator n=1 Tax=Brevibacillus reuszeri TaxID=54915 RepID=A0A0K9Z007_9BACL|nr:MarR family transcriptional regulator [Brevibacillus reuszeri]KNB74212.1 MarR family transcriptional regulator [Brevibacillus reuszeri]MED1861207.1 MarR family transcriptional regulator [Brevibacillus reuszeri]GED73072.1 transcriptional regulator [Brevibacillus reuszeri]
MSDQQKKIAKQLMESYFQSQVGGNMMQNRSIYNQKPGEIMVLYFISVNVTDDSPGLMVSEISGKLNVTSPTVTQHINSLEAQELVERHADPADRRVVRIQLSDNGKKYIQRINDARLNMFVGLVNHLGEEESLLFAEMMRKASDYMLEQQEFYLRSLRNE